MTKPLGEAVSRTPKALREHGNRSGASIMSRDPVELSAGCFDAIENRFAARESRRTAYQITKKLDLRICYIVPVFSYSNSDLQYYLAGCAEEVEVWPGHVDMIRSASAARRCRLAATSAVTVARSL